MVMEVIAALLIAAVIIPLAPARGAEPGQPRPVHEHVRGDAPVHPGRGRPAAIGGHGADKFLPFLWTLFFFILFNNLLGMIPGGASATGTSTSPACWR